jgi:hypothetical protein
MGWLQSGSQGMKDSKLDDDDPFNSLRPLNSPFPAQECRRHPPFWYEHRGFSTITVDSFRPIFESLYFRIRIFTTPPFRAPSRCGQATAMRIDIAPHKRPRRKQTRHVPDPHYFHLPPHARLHYRSSNNTLIVYRKYHSWGKSQRPPFVLSS